MRTVTWFFWGGFIVGLIAAPPLLFAENSQENGPSCEVSFLGLSEDQIEALKGHPVGGPMHRWTGPEFQKMAQLKVRDIFPLVESTRPDGTTENILRITEIEQKQFRAHFEDYLQAEAQKGFLPIDKIRDFRAWLRTQNARQEPYPELTNFKGELTAFQRSGRTLKEFYDWLFVKRYLMATQGIEPVDVEDYVRTLDPSKLRRFKQSLQYLKKAPANAWIAIKQNGKNILAVGVAMKTADMLVFGPFQDSIGKAIDQIKATTISYSKLKLQRTKLQLSGEASALNGAYHVVKFQLDEWATDSYSGDDSDPSRRLAAKTFNDRLFAINDAFPHFRALLPVVDPLFAATMEKTLNDSRLALTTKLQDLRNMSKDLDDLNAQLAKAKEMPKLPPAIPAAPPKESKTKEEIISELNTNIERVKKDLENTEGEIATLLVPWFVYKAMLDPKSTAPKELDEVYSNAQTTYLGTFDLKELPANITPRLDKLRDRLVPALQDLLKKFKSTNTF